MNDNLVLEWSPGQALKESSGPSMSGTVAKPPKPPKILLTRSWRHRASPATRYGAAVLLVALALSITYVMRKTIDTPSFQTPFFFCAIVLSAWFGGFRPGILASILSIAVVEYCFTQPLYTVGISLAEVPKFTVLLMAGGFISWLGGRQRQDEEALLKAREELEDKVEERTQDLQVTNARLTEEVRERIRAEKELQRLNRAWRVRSSCNRAVTRSADEPDLLRRVCQAIVRGGNYRLAWVGFGEAGGPVPPMAWIGTNTDREEDIRVAWEDNGCGQDLARRCVRTGQPVQWAKNRADSALLRRREWAEAHRIRSVIALPLIAEAGPIGSLLVYAEEAEAFDEKERELFQQTANDVAQGVVLLRARAARQQAEAALRKTEAELTRVARATTMGELTASIAHEINQPLAGLVTNASACLRWLGAATPNIEEARATAQRIVRDGKRAADVIARIRALLAKGQPLRQNLNINDVIHEIIPLVQGEMNRRRATLISNLPEGLPEVEMDRVQIQQILMNLMVNALDAMNSVTDRPHVLRIRTSVQDGHILVAVQDSGPGLQPEQMDKLFDAFYTTKAEGMGMGLSISRSIVEAHGGRLWAESHDGPGATFSFTLPLKEETPE